MKMFKYQVRDLNEKSMFQGWRGWRGIAVAGADIHLITHSRTENFIFFCF
jgi:hypothetical protein